MAPSSERFRELLNEGLKRIHVQEGKPMRVIEDELGYQLGRNGGAAVQHWRKGRLPPHLSDVEQLAKAVVTRGQLDQVWLEAFLRSAGHPAPAILCAEIFPNVGTAGDLAPDQEWVTSRGLLADPERRLAALPLRTLPDSAPLPLGSRMPFGRNPLFVGRTQGLLALAAALKNDQTTAAYQAKTAVVTGLGGIGKTQLASEFVHRYGQYFAGGVFWLSFDNPEGIAAEVAACGGAGALDLRPDFAQREFDEQVRLVQAAWQAPSPRLLVFDNCEEPALLLRWRPPSGGCKVLITSRRAEWEAALGVQTVRLDVLARSESLTLLANHQIDATAAVLDELAAELGDLPLALHLAGTYLHRYRRVLSAADYLAELRHPGLLDHRSFHGHGLSPTGHTHDIGRTFALSFDRLDIGEAADRLARRLLVILAHFAPGEALPCELAGAVLAYLAAKQGDDAPDTLAFEDALARLAALGLAELDLEAQEGAVRLHRLVAAFGRAADPILAADVQAAVEQVVHDRLAQANAATAPRTLLDSQAHLRYVATQALARGDAAAATLHFLLARHLWMLGDYAAARTTAEQALALRQALFGEAHLDSAAAYHYLGIIEEAGGELVAAEAHLAEALSLYIQLVGELHIVVADVLTDLGALLWSQRRVTEAIAHHRRALDICSLLPDADLVAAEAANNLATCLTIGLDNAAAARPYMEQSLAIRRARLGEEHPFTALAYNNLGSVLQRLEEPAAAQTHFMQALAIRRRVLGDLHPDTAHSLITLGELRAQQGDEGAARAYLQEALTICRATVGDAHELTIRAHTGLGALA